MKKITERLESITTALVDAQKATKRDKVKYVQNYPVAYDVEVLVAGGGISGIAAAVAAGRSGADTLLIERQGLLGGLVTAGLVTPFSMQMMLPTGEVITKGLVEELFDRLAQLNGTVYDWRDWRIPKLPVDQEVFKLVVIEMLQDAGVQILLNTTILDVVSQSSRISHVLINNKTGRLAVRANMFIDCTGEADVARFAGVPSTLNADVNPSSLKVISSALRNKGWVRRTEKTASVQFIIGNADLDLTHDFIMTHPETYSANQRGELIEDIELFTYLWKDKGFFYLPHETSFKELIHAACESGKYKTQIGRYALMESSGTGMDGLRINNTVTVNANRVMINPFNEEDVTYALIEGQKVCFEIWRFLRDYIPGFSDSNILAVAPYLGIRRGTQIIGEHIYTAEERMQFLNYTDIIGMASRKTEKAYEVPYSLMLPKKVNNLLVASGKTVSTDDYLPYRVKPVCMILGQAAGTAAALCVQHNTTPRKLDIQLLQRKLLIDGVYLGDSTRLEELGLQTECVNVVTEFA